MADTLQTIHYTPAALPPHAGYLMAEFRRAGARNAVIFGGALRDTDCSAAYCTRIPVNDYDVRLYAGTQSLAIDARRVVDNLSRAFGAEAVPATVYGENKIRFEMQTPLFKLDLSFRPFPQSAQEMAARSDLGISAIAMDGNGDVWIKPEFRTDRNNMTISVYPAPHVQRSIEYAKRLQAKKYPSHSIIVL